MDFNSKASAPIKRRREEQTFTFEYDIQPQKDFASFFVDQFILKGSEYESTFKKTGECIVYLPSQIELEPYMLADFIKKSKTPSQLKSKLELHKHEDVTLIDTLYWIFSGGKSLDNEEEEAMSFAKSEKFFKCYQQFHAFVPETNDLLAGLICQELESRLKLYGIQVELEFGTEKYDEKDIHSWQVHFDLKEFKEEYQICAEFKETIIDTNVSIIPFYRDQVYFIRIMHPEWKNVKRFKKC